MTTQELADRIWDAYHPDDKPWQERKVRWVELDPAEQLRRLVRLGR